MPKRKRIDHLKLVQMVENKSDKKKIMDYFGFTTSSQLDLAYANARIQTGRAAEVSGGLGVKTESAAAGSVAVVKRGSIVIPKKMIAELGFKAGDGFRIRRTRKGISLSRR